MLNMLLGQVYDDVDVVGRPSYAIYRGSKTANDHIGDANGF